MSDYSEHLISMAGGDGDDDWMTQATRGSFEALLRELQSAALEEAADEADGMIAAGDIAEWLRARAAELRKS